MHQLYSTHSNLSFPFDQLEEFTNEGESLEVRIDNLENARIREGKHIWIRFAEFLPYFSIDESISLGEGNTPLLIANRKLIESTGIPNLWIKNETMNPTWSFKDRGSLFCIAMALKMNEKFVATVSTGNMGCSLAAYAAKIGLDAIIFVPHFTPLAKLHSIAIHGATIIRITASDYSEMKSQVLRLGKKFNLRVVSGNGPIRTEGYKLTAFEMFEQMGGTVPDYIAIPTSACGHIRGVFKGYLELFSAGYISKLPKMIVVQAKNNCPIVASMKKGMSTVTPFSNFHTIAEAITSGNPQGGDEILYKAQLYEWLGQEVSEDEISASQHELAKSGYFVEPSSATVLSAVKKLKQTRIIDSNAVVVMVLTGSGLKDSIAETTFTKSIIDTDLKNVESHLGKIFGN